MISAADYDYELPKELIAQFPAENRADARLMVIDRELATVEHAHVRDLPDYLNRSDALVFNNSKVIPAALSGYRTKTRGRWQGLFLDADENGPLANALSNSRQDAARRDRHAGRS